MSKVTKMDNRSYLARVGDLVSQVLNTILLGGAPDESTSGRSYRQGVLQGHKGWSLMRKFVDGLFSMFEEDHCKKAYQADLERAKNTHSERSTREPRKLEKRSVAG